MSIADRVRQAWQVIRESVQPESFRNEMMPLRLAILLVPAISSSLTMEDSNSLARIILLSHPASAGAAWGAAFCVMILLVAWVDRYILSRRLKTARWAATAVKLLGFFMGVIAAIVASAPDTSVVLICGYLASSLLLLWEGAVMSVRAIRYERESV